MGCMSLQTELASLLKLTCLWKANRSLCVTYTSLQLCGSTSETRAEHQNHTLTVCIKLSLSPEPQYSFREKTAWRSTAEVVDVHQVQSYTSSALPRKIHEAIKSHFFPIFGIQLCQASCWLNAANFRGIPVCVCALRFGQTPGVWTLLPSEI